MNGMPEMVTVYRSMDMDARDDAARVQSLLGEAGVVAVIADDSVPGVVHGTYEVRVMPADAARADEVVRTLPQDEADLDSETSPVDPSHELDMETVFESRNATAELEALGVRSVLEAAEIPAFLVGDSVLPVTRFLVRVPHSRAAEARQVLEEAVAAGPAAAEEAERAGELGG